jgi:iron(II)-dependent oxidoreductase
MKNSKFQVILLCLSLIQLTTIAQEIKTHPDMVLIPGGHFTMGKDHPVADFSPAHKVRVDSFYMDTHEVTNREYLKFCEETGYKFPEFWNTAVFRSGEKFLDHPVIGVNLFDAIKYAEWAGKRLPTEAEWEYAARGGLSGKEFPNGDKWTIEKATKAESWENMIYPVESYESNGYGLYEMGGNVWEWVSDRYSENYYRQSPSDNPKGPEKGTLWVIRGGSWHSGAMCKKVYYRKGMPPNWCDFGIGFRCVKDL